MFSTISPVRSGNFNFSENMLLRYFFETLLPVLSDLCYNLKLADLQLFSDWLIFVFHYSLVRSGNFNFSKCTLSNILFWDASTGAVWFMQQFKMTDLHAWHSVGEILLLFVIIIIIIIFLSCPRLLLNRLMDFHDLGVKLFGSMNTQNINEKICRGSNHWGGFSIFFCVFSYLFNVTGRSLVVGARVGPTSGGGADP